METILKALPAFFSWLIDYTIDISIFICLILVIKSIVAKRLPAWWHYGLWLVLIIRMIIPVKYEKSSVLPEFISIKFPEVEFLNTMLIEKDDMITGIIFNTSSNINWAWLDDLSFNEIMLYAWLAGVLSIGLFILIKNFRFWFNIKQKPMLVDKDILDLLEECKITMKINTVIGIIITDAVKSPVLFGYLRPRLLLPEGVLEKLTRSELTYIFMHELGHIKRHDIGVSWIITLLQVFHWFNPLVWYAFYKMRIDQESACDASVLARIRNNQSKDYAGTIIGFLEKFCQNQQLPAMAGIIENKSQIKRRLAMIVRYKESTKRIKALAIVMLLMTGFIFYTITGFAQEGLDNKTALSEEAQKAMVEAQKLFENKEVENARNVLLDYMDTTNDTIPSDVYLMLGYYWYNDKKLDEALKVFKEGYEAYPDNQDLTSYYGATLYETGKFEEAGPLMEKRYEESDAKDIKMLEAAAASYYQTKNYDNTIRVIKEMIDFQDDPNPKTISMLIGIYMEKKDYNSAIDTIETYMDIPDAPKKAWFKQIAMCYKAQGNHEKMYEYLKKLQDMTGTEDTILSAANKTDQPENEDENMLAGEPVYVLKEVDTPPQVIEKFAAEYPIEAIEKKIEGKVVLRFIVGKDGIAHEPQVDSAEPEGIFEKSALEVIAKFKFKPAIKNGKDVNCFVRLPIMFALSGPDDKTFIFNPEGELVIRHGEIDTPPQVIEAVPPEYPIEAKEKKIEGKVVLRFILSKDGMIQDPQVKNAHPAGVFDQAALEAIVKYKFRPAKKDGMDVDCFVWWPIEFKLDEKWPNKN
ncbi:MAG: TonB family protein [Deltaproteobacteria bacterium]|nr:TonB family protein [Deltaproteobacteria bacterium]